jgi:uncharacterized protein
MSTAATTPKPMPEPDEYSRPYFEAGARGVLLLRRCEACGTWLGPEAMLCTECLSESLSWAEASGRGTLFSFGIVHQKLPGFETDVPYNVSIVQLAEGPRMTTNMVDCPNEKLTVGMPVRVMFSDAGNGTPIPRFRPE